MLAIKERKAELSLNDWEPVFEYIIHQKLNKVFSEDVIVKHLARVMNQDKKSFEFTIQFFSDGEVSFGLLDALADLCFEKKMIGNRQTKFLHMNLKSFAKINPENATAFNNLPIFSEVVRNSETLQAFVEVYKVKGLKIESSVLTPFENEQALCLKFTW